MAHGDTIPAPTNCYNPPMSKKRSKKASARRTRRRFPYKSLFLLGLAGVLALAGYTLYLDRVVQDKFEGKRWSVPSRVYARALELYPQMPLTIGNLLTELRLIGYQPSSDGFAPGSYRREGGDFVITTRSFRHWDSQEPERSIRLDFAGQQLKSLSDAVSGEPLSLVRLEPMTIGIIHPAHREDRVLVRLADLPPVLTVALQAIEDRQFASHHGLDFRAIARAAWANLRAGRVVQGGSTLTQQLVKNFYLDSERTLRRKINEAIMALLLELRYDKQAILEAYANEIYLGQDGKRAIHGFGLAAQFYFNKPPQELTLPESALLVAILRGPAYYNPRRHPERARQRRNHVIETLWRDGLIERGQAKAAQSAPLGVTPKPNLGSGRYPAFLDLVKRQLQQHYRDEDLRSEGLRIFTTLDPIIQETSERALRERILRLERDYGKALLEGGVVVTRLGTAEVSAVVGGRQPRYRGFNRALDIQRPVGSLLKPALYLTAVAQPRRYTLATLIDDGPVALKQSDGTVWSPANYDRESHGRVLLASALSYSYNQAAVHLGLDLGLGRVVETLHALGINKTIRPYPSVILGSLELAPIDMAQMYQTLGDQGFYTPLRAVREVLDAGQRPLQRYALETEQRFAPEYVHLVNEVLRMALREGTGQSVGQHLPASLSLAGKTGTTDDLRDSWFAGFGSDYVGVVWIGSDDNAVTGLTGASGALPLWADIMRQINLSASAAPPPAEIDVVAVDAETGLRAGSGCDEHYELPFVKGSAPQEYAPCAGRAMQRSVGNFWDRIKGVFR